CAQQEIGAGCEFADRATGLRQAVCTGAGTAQEVTVRDCLDGGARLSARGGATVRRSWSAGTIPTSPECDIMTTRLVGSFGVLSAITALLAGCATAKPVPLPNGQQGFAIEDCDSMAECYKKAAEVCGGKYEIVGQESGSVGTVTTTGGVIVPQYSLT